MLELDRVSKIFTRRKSLWLAQAPAIRALDTVSFSIAARESFGLVGESGSGKTTLTRLIMRLDSPSEGRILFEGENMAKLSPAALRAMRARIQTVFQDPYASLNPRMSIHDIVTEPMVIHRALLGLNARARTDRAMELLTLVGLGEQHLHRFPHEFSGGQRQRIGIARALASKPKLLLLDEPTSALDVSVQAQVLNLLHDLQLKLNLTYLFISHDLGVIRYSCDRVALLHRGRLVEQGTIDDVYDHPKSEEAKILIAAMPDF